MRPRVTDRWPVPSSQEAVGYSGAYYDRGGYPPQLTPVTPDTPTVKSENTFHRDGELSLRHRRWGFDCPAVDIDFPLVEYNNGEAAAIVEYKRAGNRFELDLTHPSMRALAGLANASRIPFIVVFYSSDPWRFQVFRGNQHAERVYRQDGRVMTEREFVESLYFMRKNTLSAADTARIAALDLAAV